MTIKKHTVYLLLVLHTSLRCGQRHSCYTTKTKGVMALPAGVQGLSDQGCYCAWHCSGVNGLGCKNVLPEVPFDDWVEKILLLNGDEGSAENVTYLVAKRDIPADTLFAKLGGVTVQALTQREAYESYTLLHRQQHAERRAPKFRYSVRAGSDGVPGRLSWLIPENDFALLHQVIASEDTIGIEHAELTALLTAKGGASEGLGQYAQHTCCPVHVNAHLFPIFMLGDDVGYEELWELRGVALRAQRLIKKGEEILIHYVGSGRSFNFSNVFTCTCCVCMGRCAKPA